MDDYLMRGNTYASVLGGGTCNSEFEFLTGASMSGIGTAMYPYVAYNLAGAYNIVSIFKELGYQTIALHPYLAENWNRINVYNNYGFDQFITQGDMDDIQCVSWGASDSYDYEWIKKLFEEKTGPLFLFNVTMQNHGGYDVELTDGVTKVQLDEAYMQYEDVVNYLTLIRESDIALNNLLNYFSEQSEPVVVCVFGDHQPSLSEEFISAIYNPKGYDELQKRYMTPYMIWSNYDILVDEDRNKDMSINYLGMNLLDIVGIHTSYSDYLLDLEEEIPVINSCGYQTKDGIWYDYDDVQDLVEEYRIVQYYELFGE